MKLTNSQKQKKMEQETNKIDKMTIIIIIAVLVISLIVGITIGKLLFNLAIANA